MLATHHTPHHTPTHTEVPVAAIAEHLLQGQEVLNGGLSECKVQWPLTPTHTCIPHYRPGKKMGLGPVSIYAWYALNSKVVMAIWKMARDQHMFYRSQRTNRVSPPPTHTHPHTSHTAPSQSAMMTNLTDIIRHLNKLHRSNISPSSSHSSLSVESAKSNQAQGHYNNSTPCGDVTI